MVTRFNRKKKYFLSGQLNITKIVSTLERID